MNLATFSFRDSLWLIRYILMTFSAFFMLAFVLLPTPQYYLYNTSGEKVNDAKYDEIEYIPDGVIRAKKKNLYFILYRSGKVSIDSLKYKPLQVTKNAILVEIDSLNKQIYIFKDKRSVTIKSEGDLVIGSIGYWIFDQNQNMWKYLNYCGDKIITDMYDDILGIFDGIIAVKQNNYWAIMNEYGEFISNFEFDDVGVPRENRIPVRKGDKYAFINYDGDVLTDYIYDETKFFRNGFCPVKIMDKWGLIDTLNILKVNPSYDEIDLFNEVPINVRNKKKWGFIDINGTEVLEFNYYKTMSFVGNYAFVKYNRFGRWKLIDKNGNQVTNLSFNKVIRVNHDLFWGMKYSVIHYILIVMILISLLAFVFEIFHRNK